MSNIGDRFICPICWDTARSRCHAACSNGHRATLMEIMDSKWRRKIMKKYVVCNHETGYFDIFYSAKETEDRIKELIEAGADLENITIMQGEESKVTPIQSISYVYSITD